MRTSKGPPMTSPNFAIDPKLDQLLALMKGRP